MPPAHVEIDVAVVVMLSMHWPVAVYVNGVAGPGIIVAFTLIDPSDSGCKQFWGEKDRTHQRPEQGSA